MPKGKAHMKTWIIVLLLLGAAAVLAFNQFSNDGQANQPVTPTPGDTQAAERRATADNVARNARLTPGTKLEFSHQEDTPAETRYVYTKVFDEPRRESPPTITVVFDKQTREFHLRGH